MPALTANDALTLALEHHRAGRPAEAESLCRQILATEPGHVDALHLLGLIAHHTGRQHLAIDLIRQSLVLDPQQPDAFCNLGEACRALGRIDEAIALYRHALVLQPDHPEACDNLGIGLAEKGQFDEAIAAHQRALQLNPGLATAHNNLGTALFEVGRFPEALAAFRAALQLRPNYSDATFNSSLVLLLQGDFERGLPLYEARQDDPPSPARQFSQPRWDGGPLDGLRLLVHAEQGFGDSIQFIRYARLLANRGAEVILESPSSLAPLLRTAPGVSQVICPGDDLPPFDRHVPLLSLPMLFHTTPETIPSEIPYLSAEKTLAPIWQEWLAGRPAALKVGLAWSGRPENARLRKRHIPLAKLLPLLAVEGVNFFSLQMDDGPDALRQLPAASHVHDLSGQLHDFADTAAFMARLDLIISVDTAVAHLAGALARPVWTLLPFVPDWRWGLAGEGTLWYPTMRLFRQSTFGDWHSVIAQVSEELRRFAKGPH